MNSHSANKYIFKPTSCNILFFPVIATEEELVAIFSDHYKQIVAHIKNELERISSGESYEQKIAVYNSIVECEDDLDEDDRDLIKQFRDEGYSVDVSFCPSHGLVRVYTVYIKVSY